MFLLLSLWASLSVEHRAPRRWLPARTACGPIIAWARPAGGSRSARPIFLAPGAAYLWLLPLLGAGLLLSIIPLANAVAVRVASALVLVLAAALWLLPTESLLHFLVAIFGRLPVVTPVFVYAAVLTAAGVMLVPPLMATITKTQPFVRPSLETSIGLFAIAITAGLAYAAPAYTHEEPLRRFARAVQEGDGPAVWDVGSVEPGVDLAEAAPPGWMPATAAPPATVPFRRFPHPFVFRATGPSLGPAPITIASLAVEPVEAGSELVVTVVPRMPGLAVAFVLPEGLEPARSNLPGIVRLGRWTATYRAPTPEGLVFRASFGRIDAGRLRDLRVVATALGPGDGSGWQPPAWLPDTRTAWTAEASWIVAPFALPIAPVPPLR
jgi:hypothetical protein